QASQTVMRRKSRELVGRTDERHTELACEHRSYTCPELGMRVQAGAHGRAAERELMHRRQAHDDGCSRMRKLRFVAGKFLSERQRCRVLQMRAADLHQVLEVLRLRSELLAQRMQRWQ